MGCSDASDSLARWIRCLCLPRRCCHFHDTNPVRKCISIQPPELPMQHLPSSPGMHLIAYVHLAPCWSWQVVPTLPLVYSKRPKRRVPGSGWSNRATRIQTLLFHLPIPIFTSTLRLHLPWRPNTAAICSTPLSTPVSLGCRTPVGPWRGTAESLLQGSRSGGRGASRC